MDIATAHTLYEVLKGRDLTFLYSDVFADDHTAAIMGVGQEALDVGTERTLRSRLSFVLVEAYQNIIRHRADNGGRSVLMLQRAGGGCVVSSFNPVTPAEGEALQQRLEGIRGLDLAQLKALFLQRLQSNSTSERGGAGLGLIEMARRSGRTPQYQLWPGRNDHLLFALHVRLGEEAPEVDNASAQDLYNIVDRCNIRILVHGEGGAGLDQALLDLSASVAPTGRVERAQRIHLAVLELMRTHQAEDPLIVWSSRAEGHVLSLGMFHSLDRSAVLAGQVTQLQGMNDAGLKRLYRDRLLGRGDADAIDLGLLDLARHARSTVVLEQVPMNDRMVSLLQVPL